MAGMMCGTFKMNSVGEDQYEKAGRQLNRSIINYSIIAGKLPVAELHGLNSKDLPWV